MAAFRLGHDSQTGIAGTQRQDGAISRVAPERLTGYREAVEAAGLTWTNVEVYERPEHSYEDGVAAGREILEAADRPSVIAAFSELLAADVIDAAKALGLRVPEDVSVVGYDDSQLAALYDLTTVHQPLSERANG